MIDISISIDEKTAEEEIRAVESILGGKRTARNIYDDVAELQSQMAEVMERLSNLNMDFVSEFAENLNDVDLNEIKGRIIVGYGNNCTNRPTTQNGYLIFVPHNSAPDRFGKQIWITRPSNNVFIRNLDDGVWGDWAYVYYDTGWRELPLASGVSAQNATEYPCRYRRLGNVVHVEGCVKGFADVEKVVANLPEGYRPNKSYYFQTATNAGKTDTFRVYTTGAIQRIATTNTPTDVNNYHFINTSFIAN